jgi:uncharacterized membrane protein YecN with MAPEG domain
MNVPTITLLYGGLTSLLLALLGLNVSLARVSSGAGLHSQVDAEMHRRIRSHGNAAEWVPISVLLLLVLELSGAPSLPLHALGGSVFAGRLLHAGAVLGKKKLGSVIGATLTYVATISMSGWAVWMHFAR